MNTKIINHIDESIKTKQNLKAQIALIDQAAEVIIKSLKSGGKLILFGNGGSAADSQHIAAEFVGKFIKKRKGLPAISLTTNTSTLTALGNDLGYDKVFSRQLEALCTKNDVVIAISTSGISQNVINGLKQAKKQHAQTISLGGKKGGKMKQLSKISIIVPSSNTQHIQESHIMIGHILVDLVESRLQRKN